MRGLISPKGELFAYIEGSRLFTLDGEPSGQIEKDYIVDLAGNRVWRLIGDGVYTLDGNETIGYIGGERPAEYDL